MLCVGSSMSDMLKHKTAECTHLTHNLNAVPIADTPDEGFPGALAVQARHFLSCFRLAHLQKEEKKNSLPPLSAKEACDSFKPTKGDPAGCA